jgi:hypothetical protein
MPEVTVAVGRAHLGSHYAVARIAAIDDVVSIERLDEAGPAATALELVEGGNSGSTDTTST